MLFATDLLNSNEGELLKKIICVDGKTMRSNKREGTKSCYIVSVWSREDGYCLGQKVVERAEKHRDGEKDHPKRGERD